GGHLTQNYSVATIFALTSFAPVNSKSAILILQCSLPPMFASIHVPDFIVAAIVRHQPELRQTATVIVDGKPPLLTVARLNGLARDAGIDIGMTKFQAEQFSGVAVRPRSLAQEAAAQEALLDCASAFSPRIEDTAAGTVILDVEGLERLFGSAAELSQNLS